MLTIRDEQQDTLGDEALRRFIERLMEFLRQEFENAKALDDKTLFPIVEGLVEAGEEHGFGTEQHIANYVTAQWLHGARLEEDYPEVAARLSDASFTLSERDEWLRLWIEQHASKS